MTTCDLINLKINPTGEESKQPSLDVRPNESRDIRSSFGGSRGFDRGGRRDDRERDSDRSYDRGYDSRYPRRERGKHPA